jgi:hypothetical protein
MTVEWNKINEGKNDPPSLLLMLHKHSLFIRPMGDAEDRSMNNTIFSGICPCYNYHNDPPSSPYRQNPWSYRHACMQKIDLPILWLLFS